MEKWLQAALDIGFDVAAPCDVETLKPMEEVREMCRADKCHAYNRNWTCPPNCGTVEDCTEKIKEYKHGILLQTVGHMKKDIDSHCYRDTGLRHMESFSKLVKAIRQEYPNALCLGAGGCRVCKQCAFPKPNEMGNCKRKPLTLFEKTLAELGIRHKKIRPYAPRHNGKVDRSHRKDNEEFYASHKFYSFEDFKKQLAVRERAYNHFLIRPLNWRSPYAVLKSFPGV